MKQRCDDIISTLKQSWNDIVQRWKTVASTMYNLDLTLFKSWTQTLYQCYATLKLQLRILFHFQRRINIISSVIRNVETTLIWRWNVGWVVSMKKVILMNSLSATLLTKWNLSVFFKDFAKTFTTPVLTNFFWWLLLRIHLRLVVSNSSGFQQVPS